MKIKLVTGATTFEACKNIIKQIDTTSIEQQNMVVVPDSFSMQAENLLFDVLKRKATFNTKIVGISKLASEILKQNNIMFERVGELEEILCIFKAVKECEPEFLYFKKCGVEFCLKILQIIKQFKGCNISPEHIKQVGDDVLDNKMHDLKLIFCSYEKLLGEKFDLSRLLEFFLKNAEKNLNLSNLNLYFVNFDSFSKEINSFICELAQYVNKVVIGMAKPLSQNNAFIYENDILKKTSEISKQFNVNVEVENFETNLKNEKLALVKNLFAFQPEKYTSDFFVNVLAKNMQDEIEFVAKYIKNRCFNGKRFNQFAIAVSDKKYYDKIKSIFEEYHISSYCDDASDLSKTILGRFLLTFLKFSKLGLDKEKIQFLVDCPLFNIENKEEILKNVDYLNIQDETELIDIYPQFQSILNLLTQLSKASKISDFTTILKDVLFSVENNFENLLSQLKHDLQFKKESENSQSKELLEKVLERLFELGKNEKMDIVDFENFFLLALKSVKVETIPSYIDAVFVGDVTESYFQDVDTLFVLGATANSLPKTQNDVGIIDDGDITKLKLNFLLEPEIKVLNRRNRLKLFECLQHAESHLIVCCPLVDEGKQSQLPSFVLDLRDIFGMNILQTASLEDFDLPSLSTEQSLKKLMFYIATNENLPNAYNLLSTKAKLSYQHAKMLNLLNKKDMPQQKHNFQLQEKNCKSLLLAKNCISASQLETYFSCPFKHFVAYGMKIREKEDVQPNKRLFGIFAHSILQKFVEENNFDISKIQNNQIENFLENNVVNLAKDVYHEKILKQKHFINFLKNEAKIILKNVVYEQKYSCFRPFLLEEKIFDKLQSSNSNIIGFVDRADKWNNFFRIFDYKTGKTENLKKDLYYGKKLQLFLYGSLLQKKLDLKCSGVYYFDCQTKYSKNNKTQILLNGITQKENDIVLATDIRLDDDEFRSDLLGMSRKKTSSNDEFAFKYGSTESDIQPLFDYAERVASLAVEEINTGYIQPKPLKNACEYCPYNAVCMHKKEDGFRETQQVKDIKGTIDED